MRKLRIARRDFLALGLAGAATGFTYGLLRDRVEEPLLRPPGAQDEEEFIARCLRCQECIRACPTGCLEPVGRDFGATRLWTPRFNPMLAKCEFELCDRACARSCPAGSLHDVPDQEVKMGTAVINNNHCIAWANWKNCLVCYERCTHQAIDVDDNGRPHVIEDKCTGCGACQNACVEYPDPAIVVFPLSFGQSPTIYNTHN